MTDWRALIGLVKIGKSDTADFCFSFTICTPQIIQNLKSHIANEIYILQNSFPGILSLTL
jgi:hypothetical protein